MSIKESLDAIEAWYWDHGVLRIGHSEHPLNPDWVADIHGIRRQLGQARERVDFPKPAIAIYGESRAGKSTMLMTELDDTKLLAGGECPGVPLSAIQWSETSVTWGDWSAWSHAGGWVQARCATLNPFTEGADATAVPTRFTLADRVSEPAAPYRITLQSMDGVMASVFAGLSDHATSLDAPCPEPPPAEPVALRPTEVSASVRSALTMLEAINHVIRERELFVGRAGDRARRLRPFSIQDVFPCTIQEAIRWAGGYLFGTGAQLFVDICTGPLKLLQTLAFFEQFDGIVAGPHAAKFILTFAPDGDTSGAQLSFYSRSMQGERQLAIMAAEDTPLPTEWRREHARELSTPTSLAMQLVIRELVVPVRDSVLARRNPAFAAVLRCCDVIDFPGLSLMPDATRDLPDRSASRQAFMLKSGKAACVLRDFIAHDLIDGMLFVCKFDDRIRDSTVELMRRVLTRVKRRETQPANGDAQHSEQQNFPFWWIASRWTGVNLDVAEKFISVGIESLGEGIRGCRFSLFATHYPIWPDMFVDDDEAIRIGDGMRTRLVSLTQNGPSRDSFDALQLTELEPGGLLESTQCIWHDLKSVVGATGPQADSPNWVGGLEREICQLLLRNQALPGGDQETLNQARRTRIRELEAHLRGREVRRERVLSVSPLTQLQSAKLCRSVSGEPYEEELYKALKSALREHWRAHALDELSLHLSRSEATAFVDAIEHSVWMSSKVNLSLRNDLLPLLPHSRPASAQAHNQLDSLVQLFAMRLGDWLTGNSETPHGLGTRDMEGIALRLASQDARYGNRDPLPGDEQLASISLIQSIIREDGDIDHRGLSILPS